MFLRVVKQDVYICTVLAWTSLVINVTFLGYNLFNTNYLDLSLTPLGTYVPVSYNLMLVVRSIAFIVFIYMTAAGSFPPAMTFLCALMFWREFRRLNSRFITSISGRQFRGDFELYRLRHQRLSRLVEEADRMLWMCNAGNLICHTATATIELYIFIIHWSIINHAMLMCLLFFYLMSSVADVGLTTLGAILVNNVITSSVLN